MTLDYLLRSWYLCKQPSFFVLFGYTLRTVRKSTISMILCQVDGVSKQKITEVIHEGPVYETPTPSSLKQPSVKYVLHTTKLAKLLEVFWHVPTMCPACSFKCFHSLADRVITRRALEQSSWSRFQVSHSKSDLHEYAFNARHSRPASVCEKFHAHCTTTSYVTSTTPSERKKSRADNTNERRRHRVVTAKAQLHDDWGHGLSFHVFS